MSHTCQRSMSISSYVPLSAKRTWLPIDWCLTRAAVFGRLERRTDNRERTHRLAPSARRPGRSRKRSLPDYGRALRLPQELSPGPEAIRSPANGGLFSEALERAFAGMCSRTACPQRRQAERSFPANRPKADARTRTGDPFITSYGRLSRRVIASHFRAFAAPNPPDWR
jgi:hypothetical protein